MRIDYLREFLELASNLNFSTTARKLNLSQSALSMHIVALERDLNTKLFIRGKTNALSEQGKAFVEYASKIVSLYNEAKLVCCETCNPEFAPIKVHKMDARVKAVQLLIEKIYAYRKIAPETKIQLIDNIQKASLDLLIESSIDVSLVAVAIVDKEAFVENLYTESGIIAVPFCEDEPAILIPKTSDLANKERVSVHDLEGHTLVYMDHPLSKRRRMTNKRFFESYSVNCSYALKSFFSEDDFFMSDFKTNEAVLMQKSFFESNPIIKMRDDLVVKLFAEPVTSTFYIGYRADNQNLNIPPFVEFLTS